MDIWSTILLYAFLYGLFGWCAMPLTHFLGWYLNWYEGADVDWGWNVTLAIAVPFAWVFSITEIMLLFFN